ncbi:chorismate mutase [Chitinimonas koreensis]|uniref:chorismate mutase n=1 Tax=Chitinimonas koreensis TaxID=356302 RepID=UPI0004284046|nr:chorismate mutase [Chitinimonas koreensis]QNM96348.1 chorismate mutase [Chitinimonas koreensis]
MSIRHLSWPLAVLLSALPCLAADDGALDALAGLSAARLRLADLVAASKWHSGQPIEDAARERVVLQRAVADAAAAGIDAGWAGQVFAGQIAANKAVQAGLHAQWREAGEAPARQPDLAQEVRPAIDELNGRLLAALPEAAALRRQADCAERAAAAALRGAERQGLDALHRAALGQALAALCDAPQRR